MKLKLKDAYTTFMGAVEFVDGVSVHPVSIREANARRACFSGVQILQDDGVTVDEVLDKIDQLLPREVYVSAGMEVPSPFLPNSDGTYPVPADVVSVTPTAAPVEELELALPENPRYTVAELEAIADKSGIAGLRALAEPLGIKGTSIRVLISALSSLAATPAENGSEGNDAAKA